MCLFTFIKDELSVYVNSKPGYFLYNQRYFFSLAGIKIRGDRTKED